MTDWTPEKLDALPDATMITATPWGSTPDLFIGLDHDSGRDWHGISRGAETSAWLTDPTNIDPGSIRVVSVPIDALLACTLPQPKPVMTIDGIEHDASVVAQAIVHAAIAHVTGGAA